MSKKSCIMLLTIKLRNATMVEESEVRTLINTNKIKGRIAEMGLTQKEVADTLNIAQSTVSQKINNIRPMNLDEAMKMADLLHLKPDEFGKYFFT